MEKKHKKAVFVQSSWEYCELLKAQMQIAQVTLEKLSEGLCSPSMLSRFCSGERTANKMMRDRLVQRLGLSDNRNENFLFFDEYEKWKNRQQIINLINAEETDIAQEMLLEYIENCDSNNNIEQQFCLVMQAQILSTRGLFNSEYAANIEKALKLTVPNIDIKKICELQVDVQELDLILEYEKFFNHEKLSLKCDELLEYVNTSTLDMQGRAKIIPKIVFYQCKAEQHKEQPDLFKILSECDKAIEYLRKSGKMYYLWELLIEREWIYDQLINIFKNDDRKKFFSKMKDENTAWKSVLEEMYHECDMKPCMKNNCYLYLQKNTYCINEVIRKRRIMFGLTKKQLGTGICSEKTIGRVENSNAKMQLAIVRDVFEKLNMSGEYQRIDIVTQNPKAYEKLECIVQHGNDRDYSTALKELEELEALLPMEETLNQQYVKRQRAIMLYQSGEGSKEETMLELLKALECTVSYHQIVNNDDFYLTSGEITCIQNMAFVQGKESMNDYFIILRKICNGFEINNEIEQNISMYEFLMTSIASVLGNIGQYGESDTLSKNIMRVCARNRRFGTIASNIYSIAWNKKEMDGASYSKEVWENTLLKCAMIFHIEKKYNTENVLRKK